GHGWPSICWSALFQVPSHPMINLRISVPPLVEQTPSSYHNNRFRSTPAARRHLSVQGPTTTGEGRRMTDEHDGRARWKAPPNGRPHAPLQCTLDNFSASLAPGTLSA